MKDYVTVAGQLGVSHLLIVSQTTLNSILRIGKFPDGPTLHFKINRFSLCSNVRAQQKRPFNSLAAFMTPPLVVLNNFSQSEVNIYYNIQSVAPTFYMVTVSCSIVPGKPHKVDESHLPTYVPHDQCQDRKAERLSPRGSLPLQQGRRSGGDAALCRAGHPRWNKS